MRRGVHIRTTASLSKMPYIVGPVAKGGVMTVLNGERPHSETR